MKLEDIDIVSGKSITNGANFREIFNKIAFNETIKIIWVDCSSIYYDDDFPIVIDESLSFVNTFMQFAYNVRKYTIDSSFKPFVFANNTSDYYHFNDKSNKFYEDSVIRINSSEFNWKEWKYQYESFFKLVWLLDSYLLKNSFDFPMGLRYIKDNKFLIHPGGTRQSILNMFAGVHCFIINDNINYNHLKKFIVREEIIGDYDRLKSILNVEIYNLCSSIKYFIKSNEYEFMFNINNNINLNISEFAKQWFYFINNIQSIELLIEGHSNISKFYHIDNYFRNIKVVDDGIKWVDDIIVNLFEKIKLVTKFSNANNIKYKLSQNVSDIFLLPYMIGTNIGQLNTKNGIFYKNPFKNNNVKFNYIKTNFKDFDVFIDGITSHL